MTHRGGQIPCGFHFDAGNLARGYVDTQLLILSSVLLMVGWPIYPV